MRGYSHGKDDYLCSREFDERDCRNRTGNQESHIEKARHPRVLGAAQFLLVLARTLNLGRAELTVSSKIPMMAVYPSEVLSRYWKRYNKNMTGIKLSCVRIDILGIAVGID